jgi:hypothetical protein
LIWRLGDGPDSVKDTYAFFGERDAVFVNLQLKGEFAALGTVIDRSTGKIHH